MTPNFPPLLTGLAVMGDPFRAACDAARTTDPGTVFYMPDDSVLAAAILLAPETPLAEAIAVSFAVSLGFSDALGALAPPEVAVHFVWPDRIRVNGALCGSLRAASSTIDPDVEPDWLVLGLTVPLRSADNAEPGATPDETTLHGEGCGDITAPDLLEAWARHMMNWLHIYLTDGFAPLHENWRGKAHGKGEVIGTPVTGTFLGLDERGGMILKTDEGTRILPLTRLLEHS